MDMNCFTADFPGDIFWYNESQPAAKRSAFKPFQCTPKSAFDHPINGSNNMNKRVIMFLRIKQSLLCLSVCQVLVIFKATFD